MLWDKTTCALDVPQQLPYGLKVLSCHTNSHICDHTIDVFLYRETDVSSSALLAAAGSLKPDELDQSTIDELISANLKQQLEVLTEEDLTAAVHNFVDKDEKARVNKVHFYVDVCYSEAFTGHEHEAFSN